MSVHLAALPRFMLVTPEPGPLHAPDDRTLFLDALQASMQAHDARLRGTMKDDDRIAPIPPFMPSLSSSPLAQTPPALLVLLRAPRLDHLAYCDLLASMSPLCEAANARVVAHIDGIGGLDKIDGAGADGLPCDAIHLGSRTLRSVRTRPVPTSWLLSAACHDAAEIDHALSIGVDCITLSPVLPTRTHPDATPLGWDRFAILCKRSTVPVFGLGGLSPQHLPHVRRLGGHGIAAIRGLWCEGTRGQ